MSSKSILVFLLLSAMACNEPCLDMDLIDEKTVEMQSWYTNTVITEKLATSSIGISDDVELVHYFNNSGDTIWDDCGNASESERSTVQYNFFNFPFSIETEFNKQGEENGFTFSVRYNTYRANYKFTSESSSSTNTIDYITNVELNGIIYPEAFKITFNQPQDDYDVNEVIFVKDLGIIQILLNDGTEINLE